MLLSFAFISVFYLFEVNTITSKNALQREVFKLLRYLKLTKLKEVRKLVIRWPKMTYCKKIVSNSSWYLPDNKLATNICAKCF